MQLLEQEISVPEFRAAAAKRKRPKAKKPKHAHIAIDTSMPGQSLAKPSAQTSLPEHTFERSDTEDVLLALAPRIRKIEKELKQLKRKSDSAAQRNKLWLASAAILILLLGLLVSDDVAKYILATLPSGVQMPESWITTELRLVISLFLIFPLRFIARMDWPQEVKAGVIVIVVGVCVFLSQFLDHETVSHWSDAFGLAGSLVLPILGLFVWRRDFRKSRRTPRK